MKKILFYLLVTIFGVSLSWLIYLDQIKVSEKVMTIQTAYVVMDDDPKVEIPLFISGKNHPILSMEAIEKVSLVSMESDSKLQVNLTKIRYVKDEVYLNQTYQEYHYHIELPIFDQRVILNDLVFKIDFINGKALSLSIGKLSISPSKPLEGHLDWKTLSGTKVDQAIFERVGCIEIGIFSLKHDITGFHDGFQFSERFQIKDDVLYLYVSDEPFILQTLPIEIYFSDGTTQQIPQFVYMNSYHLLKMSGPLIHTYDLSSSV